MLQSGTWTITAPAPPPTVPAEERLLTIPEVAETCRLPEKAIRRAIDRGQLKAFKLCNRIRISHEDMREWIASQRQPTVSLAVAGPSSTKATAALAARQPIQRRRATEPPAGSFRALVTDADPKELRA